MKSKSQSMAAIVLVATLWLAGCTTSSGRSSYTATDRATQQESTRQAVTPAAKPKKMPKHGTVIWLASKSNTKILKSNIRNGGAGTLAISVPAGERSYYVKLSETYPGRGHTLGVIIAPGSSVSIDVPQNGDSPTTYELRYAAGTQWFGKKKSFGPEGLYAVADDSFTFEEGTGWRVELSLRVGGNLGQSGLDYEQF